MFIGLLDTKYLLIFIPIKLYNLKLNMLFLASLFLRRVLPNPASPPTLVKLGKAWWGRVRSQIKNQFKY